MQTPGLNRNSPSRVPEDPLVSASRPLLRPLILVAASARAAAESARRAGFSPIVVDQFGDRETIAAAGRWYQLEDLRRPNGPQNFARIAPENTPIAIVGGLRGGYEWISCPSDRFQGADPELFSRCDQPGFLAAIALQAGVNFPETLMDGAVKSGWLVKRLDSSGGLGVQYADTPAVIPEHSYLQQPVRGRVFGACYVSTGDRCVLVAVSRLLKKRMGDRPFVFAGALGPITLAPPIVESLQRIGDAFIKASAITGPFNVDVIIDRDSVWLLEINPRWSASMEIVERACSNTLEEPCSFFDSTADWMRRGDRIQAFSQQVRGQQVVYLKRILYASRDRRVSPTDFRNGCEDGQWTWTDVPASETAVGRHEPVATMMTDLNRMSLGQALRVKV